MRAIKSKRTAAPAASLLIITGTMGAGKTAVLAEASDILRHRRIVHAGVDVDAMALAYFPSSAAADDALMYKNLRSVCRNYAALGVRRFLLARAIETTAELNACREIVSAKTTVVCRLMARIETMERRIEIREPGMSQRECVARVAILNDILDRAQLEDFAVVNENRSLTEVAREMLLKAGWISD